MRKERRKQRRKQEVLVEAALPVLGVGVEEHLQGVVLDVGVAHHLLADGVVVAQLLLHLEEDTGSQSRAVIGSHRSCDGLHSGPKIVCVRRRSTPFKNMDICCLHFQQTSDNTKERILLKHRLSYDHASRTLCPPTPPSITEPSSASGFL